MSWIGLAYVAGGSIAGVLYISFEQFGLPALMITVPVIAMFLSTLHYYFERKEDDQRHMEELQARARAASTAPSPTPPSEWRS